MRPIKLIPVLAGAATLLALAPAGVLARPGRAHARPHNARPHKAGSAANCRLSIFAEPRVITAGEPVGVAGQLRCPHGGSTAGLPVSVFQHEAHASPLKLAASVATNPGGVYQFVTSSVLHDTVFYAVSGSVRSRNRTVRVAPQVTLGGPVETAALLTGRRNKVTFAGTVTPEDAGAVVELQRESSSSVEEWAPIQFGVVRPGGAFSFTHTFVLPGELNLRVVVLKHDGFGARGISNTLSYTVSQPQNPNLTLSSSATPASYGQMVTYSGIVKGAAVGTPVELQSHPRGRGKPFAPVAKGVTKAGGEYSFTLAALQNAVLRANSGAVKSALLVQGVRYALSLTSTPAATLASGSPFTVSGSVVPVRPGHRVYLERENAFKGGFHVVDVGTEGPSGAFTIQHTLFALGKPAVFRIHVPGDPENQGVSSPTFTIQVTPAPPSLQPVIPGKLPS